MLEPCCHFESTRGFDGPEHREQDIELEIGVSTAFRLRICVSVRGTTRGTTWRGMAARLLWVLVWTSYTNVEKPTPKLNLKQWGFAGDARMLSETKKPQT